jgi:hypothetical protein
MNQLSVNPSTIIRNHFLGVLGVLSGYSLSQIYGNPAIGGHAISQNKANFQFIQLGVSHLIKRTSVCCQGALARKNKANSNPNKAKMIPEIAVKPAVNLKKTGDLGPCRSMKFKSAL